MTRIVIGPGSISNPMTTTQDLIVAGASGIPTRLPVGTTGQQLLVRSDGTLAYSTPTAISAKAWGATGDGVVDDTTFIAAIINANNTSPGREFAIPAGTYKITSALPQITSPLHLHGAVAGIVPASLAGTVLSFAAGVPGLNFGAGAQMSVVKNIYLKSASSVLGTDDGIISLAHGLSVENVVIDGFGRDGVNMDTTSSGNCNNCTLRNVRSVNNKRDGFRYAGGNSNIITTDTCSAVTNSGWGFNNTSAACLYLDAHTDSNATGAYRDVGNGNTYLNPYTETGTGDNVTLSGTGTTWIEGTFTSSVITNTATNTNVMKTAAWQNFLRLNDPATSNLWQMSAGSFGAGYFALTQQTNSKNIFDIDAAATRMEVLINLTVGTAGQGLRVKEGSNAKQGTATLTAGTVVVSNTSVTATSRIMLTPQDNNTTGALRVSARSAGTSFTITSSNAGDTGVVAFQIFEPG